ncbi:MAG: hypothetical protein IJZ29_00025 [Clostridia bacterium]|nr:hypothetical protein [Clostridia bacterium]
MTNKVKKNNKGYYSLKKIIDWPLSTKAINLLVFDLQKNKDNDIIVKAIKKVAHNYLEQVHKIKYDEDKKYLYDKHVKIIDEILSCTAGYKDNNFYKTNFKKLKEIMKDNHFHYDIEFDKEK